MKGKDLCEFLKNVRRKLAEANGISYEPRECTHKGDCPGTCPLCDAEMKYLLDEFDKMEKDGKQLNIDVLSEEEKEFFVYGTIRGEKVNLPDDKEEVLTGDVPFLEEELHVHQETGIVESLEEEARVLMGEPRLPREEEILAGIPAIPYDFRPDEKSMVDVWEKIIDYLLSDIFKCFGITMSNLKKYAIVKNRIPVGLNNIIQQLRIEQKYITEDDLKNDNFYQINFPDLYPQTKGYFSSFFSGINSLINIAGGKMGCKEENDNNEQQMPIRTDISEEDKNKIIPENTLIFNFEKFRTHSNHVLSVLNDILSDNDNEVIPTSHFIKIIKEKYTKKEDEIGGIMTLTYGVQYIDYVLYYLMKIKKITLFEIESSPKNIECIKLLKDINDTVSEKDKAIAKICVHIELLEKRINESSKKEEELHSLAKEKLKKGDKQGAKNILMRKKQYQKQLEN